MILAIILGLVFGAASGLTSRYILGKTLYKDSSAFNTIWLSLMCARLVLVLLAFVVLYKTAWLPVVPFIGGMIIMQTITVALPLKQARKKAHG